MGARIIAICNHKGGIGKTTTAINLSAALVDKGEKVLLIDSDPQANSTSVLLKDVTHKKSNSIYNLLIEDGYTFGNICVDSKVDGLKIVPSSIRLFDLETKLLGKPDSIIGYRSKLDNAVVDEFDYIIIDCPPNLGMFVTNSLVIANYYIIPIEAESQFAIEGMPSLLNAIEQVRKINSNIQPLKFLITKYDKRTLLSRSNHDAFVKKFGNQNIFTTLIRMNTDLNKANNRHQTIFQFDRRRYGAEDYLKLAGEIIKIFAPGSSGNISNNISMTAEA